MGSGNFDKSFIFCVFIFTLQVSDVLNSSTNSTTTSPSTASGPSSTGDSLQTQASTNNSDVSLPSTHSVESEEKNYTTVSGTTTLVANRTSDTILVANTSSETMQELTTSGVATTDESHGSNSKTDGRTAARASQSASTEGATGANTTTTEKITTTIPFGGYGFEETPEMITGLVAGFSFFVLLIVLFCVYWHCCCDHSRNKVGPGDYDDIDDNATENTDETAADDNKKEPEG